MGDFLRQAQGPGASLVTRKRQRSSAHRLPKTARLTGAQRDALANEADRIVETTKLSGLARISPLRSPTHEEKAA